MGLIICFIPAINPVNTYLQDISTTVVKKSLKKWFFLFSTWRRITLTSPWALINRFRSFFKFSIKFGVKKEPDRLVLGFICSIGGISGATLELIFKLRFSCNLSLFCLQLWNISIRLVYVSEYRRNVFFSLDSAQCAGAKTREKSSFWQASEARKLRFLKKS